LKRRKTRSTGLINKMNENKEKGYVIPHTHWDREWRYPLWKNRQLLIDFFRQLLSVLDNDPEYRCFLLDGQCSPVDDYLEVMPQDKEKLCGYIKEGRIAIGPWYTLPDLYPVDGECLVRNLIKGMRVAEEYGQSLKVAYMTFGWGQTAQLPQIYDQCGFDFIICAKKVSPERAPNAEFLWESPDGTQVLTTRLGEFARAGLLFYCYIDCRYGVEFLGPDYQYKPEVCGMAYHPADENRAAQDHFLIEPKKGLYPQMLKDGLEKAWQATDNTLVPGHRLFLNGCDFSSPQPELGRFLRDANALLKDREMVNATLEEYARVIHREIDRKKLRVVKGELRDGPSYSCSGNALATRIYLKQLNKQVQNQLLRRTEPYTAFMGLMGKEYQDKMIDIAWKYLFQCHAHDSINGVTQDKTADDVENRLQQALEISEVVFDRVAGDIVRRIDLSSYSPNDILLVVFNSLPRNTNDVIKVCIDLPQSENMWNFTIADYNGNPVAVQEYSKQEHVAAVHDLDGRPWPYNVDRHNIYIETGDVPAYGYKVYSLRKKEAFKRNFFYDIEMRTSAGEEIGTSNNVLENEYLKITANPGGTIDLVDKERGKEYKGLHYFEDSGDVGNYWAYYPPYNNEVITSQGSPCKISMKANGPLCATLAVETTMKIPVGGDRPDYGVRGPSQRHKHTVDLTILSEFILKKGSRRVDVHTSLTNTAENHRLRVAFPTGIKTEVASSSGHFTVDTRPAISTRDSEGNFFPEMNTLPMQHFVDVSDGKNGLAFLNNCLTEYELDRTTLYLTLFRAMNNEINTGWRVVNKYPDQKGSQLLRNLEFDYAIYPHSGNWEKGHVYHEAEHFNSQLYPVQISGQPQHDYADAVIEKVAATPERTLPLSTSLFEIDAEHLILSAIKKAEDRDTWIIRLFNPTDHEIKGSLKFFSSLNKAFYATINEERKAEITFDKEKNILPVTAGPNKIVTIEVAVQK